LEIVLPLVTFEALENILLKFINSSFSRLVVVVADFNFNYKQVHFPHRCSHKTYLPITQIYLSDYLLLVFRMMQYFLFLAFFNAIQAFHMAVSTLKYPQLITNSKLRQLHMQSTTEHSPIDLNSIGADISIPKADKIVKIIMKFGGSSLANAERVTYVGRLIQRHVESGYKPTIVCSAMVTSSSSSSSSSSYMTTFGVMYIHML
jgi:hypothetical protein